MKITVKTIATAVNTLVGNNTDTEIIEGITGQDVIDWINAKVAQADTRAAKAKEHAKAKKNEENKPILDEIANVLANGPKTVKEMKEASDLLGSLSSQKIGAVMRASNGTDFFYFTKKVKGVNTYSLTAFEEEE